MLDYFNHLGRGLLLLGLVLLICTRIYPSLAADNAQDAPVGSKRISYKCYEVLKHLRRNEKGTLYEKDETLVRTGCDPKQLDQYQNQNTIKNNTKQKKPAAHKTTLDLLNQLQQQQRVRTQESSDLDQNDVLKKEIYRQKRIRRRYFQEKDNEERLRRR